MLPIINLLLSFLTITTQFFLLWIILYLFISPGGSKKLAVKFLTEKNVTLAIFIISLVATGGSLYYSEIAGFEPCDLCWFQRIFMYPQVVILAIALFKKEYKLFDYSIGLASMGILISLYQNYLIYAAVQSSTCFLSAVSCTTKTILGLGYVTLPLMALTAFALIITTLLLHKFFSKK